MESISLQQLRIVEETLKQMFRIHKKKNGNPFKRWDSRIYSEVPGGFEPPWTVLQTVD